MRQRNAAICLGILYLLVLLRPGLPRFLFELNKTYIQTDLCEQREIKGNCCRGSCFIRKNLAQDEQRKLPIQTMPSELIQWMPSHSCEPTSCVRLRPKDLNWHIPHNKSANDQCVVDQQAPPPWTLHTALA